MTLLVCKIYRQLLIFKLATLLHLRRWSRYRADVLIWMIGIWVTLGIQFLTALTFFDATNGNFFGYSKNDIYIFFGIAMLSTGLAQSIVHGAVIRLGNSVYRGEFDYWLVQPISFFNRLLIEEIGLVWFWPHIFLGVFILQYFTENLHFALIVAICSAVIEACFVLCLCAPAIKWSRWNPEDGLWEYMEKSRSIPILRSGSILLVTLSALVVQYSLALEVLSGALSLGALLLIALVAILIAFLVIKFFIGQYASASS